MSLPAHSSLQPHPLAMGAQLEIQPNPYLAVSHQKRLAVARAFLAQYTRIFGQSKSHAQAVSMALDDERRLSHSERQTDDAAFTRAAANHLARLKRIPPITPLTYPQLIPCIHSDDILIRHGFPTCDKTQTPASGEHSDPSAAVSTLSVAQLHALSPYVVSRENTGPPPPLPPLHVILVLKCEVCHTTHGVEPSRVCVLDCAGEKLLDVLVRPEGEILDLNSSSVSGLQNLDQAASTLKSVRTTIWDWINDDTILIGHKLHHDLNALRLIHPTVVDTAILFQPHEPTPDLLPPSLDALALRYLQTPVTKTPQRDCYEDAKICLQLVRYYLKNRTETS